MRRSNKPAMRSKNEKDKTHSRKLGRPTKYHPNLNNTVYRACLNGATDKTLAKRLGVSESTLNKWKNEYPEFSESIHKGKEIADDNVAFAAYSRAVGFTNETITEKVFAGETVAMCERTYYPPDPQSMRMWLYNRNRNNWSDRRELEVKGPLEDKTLEEIQVIRKQLELKIAALTHGYEDYDSD